MTEQNNITPTSETATPEAERAGLQRMLDFMPQYRPSLLAAKLDYLINGDQISEDFQRGLMVLIDDEMIELHLSCGQPELIYHSFPFFINELTEERGAAEAYQMLRNIERLTFDYTFNDNDYLKHKVGKLRAESVQSLVLTMVGKCQDDESKIAFLKAYMSLECGEEDLNKQFDIFKELFGWSFSKTDVIPDEMPETEAEDVADKSPEEIEADETFERFNIGSDLAEKHSVRELLAALLKHSDIEHDQKQALFDSIAQGSFAGDEDIKELAIISGYEVPDKSKQPSDLAKALSSVLNNPLLPEKLYNALQEGISDLSQPAGFFESAEYLEKLIAVNQPEGGDNGEE